MKKKLMLIILILSFALKSPAFVNGKELVDTFSTPIFESAFSQAIAVINMPYALLAKELKNAVFAESLNQSKEKEKIKITASMKTNPFLY